MREIIDGAWIIRALRITGKSQKGLAEALGRTPPVVTQILNRKRAVKSREEPVILKYFGLSDPAELGKVTSSPTHLIDRNLALVAITQMLMSVAARARPIDLEIAEEAAQLVLEVSTLAPEDSGEKRTPDIVRIEIAAIARTLLRPAREVN